MSATDTLCAMLADRHEEFFVNDFGVNWRYYSDPHTATESMDGTLIVTGLTPEQAIAATLGTGTCEMDVLTTGDCAYYECYEYIMHCNGCGHEFGHVLYNEDGDVWMSEVPNFCPNCGRRIKVEE